MVRRAKTMKTLPDHQAADVDSLSDLGLFNLPRVAGRTLMSMAVHVAVIVQHNCEILANINTEHVSSTA